MIHNVFTEEERIYILNFVNKKLENLGINSPGLQTKPNLHTFKEMNGQVKMIDEIHYALPVQILRELIHPLIIKPQLKKIFSFRFKVIEEKFKK